MSVSDLVTLAVIRNALLTTAAEMKMITMQSSYSTILRESGDLSCAILSPQADVVSEGADDIPVHVATMPFSMRGALSRIPLEELEPGDAVMHNLPDLGNNHLPDVLVARPIFVEGRIIAFAAVRAHWTDIGGAAAGSYATNNEDYQTEGLRIPPVKIYRRDHLNEDLAGLIFENVRAPNERIGDLQAQYAGCLTGDRRMQELAAKHGVDVLTSAMAEILDHSERLTRVEIARIPDGEYPPVTGYFDGDWLTGGASQITVAITVSGSDLTVDFTGTDQQTPGAINAPLAVTVSAVQYAIKAATDPWNPANSGSARPVHVIAPEGTIVNARLPGPVVVSNHETSNVIVDVLFSALAQACADQPQRFIAGSYASGGPMFLGGADQRPGHDGRPFVYLEVNAGGNGARYDKDGLSATRCGTGNTGNQPIEVVESEYPVRVHEYTLVADTGGPGEFRGGLAARRRTEMLDRHQLTLATERSRVPASGVFGGSEGALGEYTLEHNGEQRILFSKTDATMLDAGDMTSIQPAGGAGFGDPLKRDPAAVAEDVKLGYVSREAASRDYGVVLTDALDHDAEATQALRESTAERTSDPIPVANRT
jgi:N-methylhydantoinase B